MPAAADEPLRLHGDKAKKMSPEQAQPARSAAGLTVSAPQHQGYTEERARDGRETGCERASQNPLPHGS